MARDRDWFWMTFAILLANLLTRLASRFAPRAAGSLHSGVVAICWNHQRRIVSSTQQVGKAFEPRPQENRREHRFAAGASFFHSFATLTHSVYSTLPFSHPTALPHPLGRPLRARTSSPSSSESKLDGAWQIA